MSYVRVSILGALLTTEVWSINPTFDPTGEFPGSVNQASLDAAALAIAGRTIPTTMRELMSPSASRTGARVEVRDDADDSLLAISTQTAGAPQLGSGTLRLPPQSAMVISVRTDTPGASGRGRLYWPAMGATLDSSGRMFTPTPATLLNDFKTYLNGIRNDLATAFPTIGFDLAVRSKTTHTTPHAVRLQVGNVVDTQRRRRDNLAEAYATTTFPT